MHVDGLMIMSNKKAAELPMNFIVIAAIAILVLILVTMFFFGGFRTQAIDSQTAANSCSAICFAKQRVAVDETKPSVVLGMDTYCTLREIKGFGTKTCSDLTSCILTFSNGDCKVNCTSAGPSCV